ncbi:hypothetical protein, partial [Yersinia wautersii]|uniref:hypothetical protein n=1 Tax=Yersinia wautersii TaxID=1341643 RepID=UPI001EE36834
MTAALIAGNNAHFAAICSISTKSLVGDAPLKYCGSGVNTYNALTAYHLNEKGHQIGGLRLLTNPDD